MGEVLKKFGRYFLLDLVAQGGMAEIYRARLASIDGAGRLIVIKKIQAGYGGNSEFLQMFKSEIKVTMGFNHPNIVQLYDFGEESQQPYIAMEFVDGKNLRQFNSRFSELKQNFPVELAAHIIEQAASGLHYAHSFKDKITGNPLNIVHRDISPQNILISYEGNVKVIDFGIAKATTNLESTRAGVIKGKPSYLSPEQISGEILDGRSDIFALGAVFWELLTGKKLFSGENDLAVLKLIESCQTHVKPPSTVNPKVPKELDFIVLRTLTKQREKRYQTAEELQRALHKFLYTYSPDFNPSDLAYYAKDLFKNEIIEDRKKIQRLYNKVETLLSSEVLEIPAAHPASSPSGPSKNEEETRTILENKNRSAATGGREMSIALTKDSKIEIEAKPKFWKGSSSSLRQESLGHATAGVKKNSSPSSYSHAPRQKERSNRSQSSAGKTLFLAAAITAVVSVFGPDFGVKVPILSDLFSEWVGGGEARLILQGNKKGVTVAVNGQTLARALPATLTGIPVGTPFRVTVTGQNESFQKEITLKKGEKKVIDVTLSPEQISNPALSQVANLPSDKTTLLKLNISPAGGSPVATISGKTVDPATLSLQVPLDEPLELNIERQGYKTFRREFVLDAKQINGLKEWMMEVQLEPTRFGFLTIHTTPSANATIILDGIPWTKKTPIEDEKLPVGDYNVKLSNEVLGMEKIVKISIQESKSVNIDERLEIKN
jgi:serine/threonine-protein kinase